MNLFFFFLGILISSYLFLMLGFAIETEQTESTQLSSSNHQPQSHKLAIIVPFRERFDELLKFVPHLSKFLRVQSIDFKIFIINQIDELRFNRASLINVGFLESMRECDYMAMHDVDLLPMNANLSYAYPSNGIFHLSAPGLHPIYD